MYTIVNIFLDNFNHGNYKNLVLTPEYQQQTETATMEPFPFHIYYPVQP